MLRECKRMSGLRRVVTAGIFWVGFVGRLRMKFTTAASCLRDRRDGVFEDQLFLRSGLEQDGKLIKTSDAAGQLGPVEEVHDHRCLLTANRVEKSVLNVLWCLFAVRHA